MNGKYAHTVGAVGETEDFDGYRQRVAGISQLG